jgi:hypothetical protein
VTDLIQRLKNWNSPYKRNDFVLFFRLCFKPKWQYIFIAQKLAA